MTGFVEINPTVCLTRAVLLNSMELFQIRTRDVTEIRLWPFQMEVTSLPQPTDSLPFTHPERESCVSDLLSSNGSERNEEPVDVAQLVG